MTKKGYSLADVPKALRKMLGKGVKINQKGNSGMFQIQTQDGKKYFIKLAGSQLVVRVGGGWQQLHKFLISHRGDATGATRGRASVSEQVASISKALHGEEGATTNLSLGHHYTSAPKEDGAVKRHWSSTE
jgi:hypothetical protein